MEDKICNSAANRMRILRYNLSDAKTTDAVLSAKRNTIATTIASQELTQLALKSTS
jgi:hypothetical protein